METVWFSETSVVFCQTIWRHISEHDGLNCLLTAKKLLYFPLLSKSLRFTSAISGQCCRTNSVSKSLAKFPHGLSWSYAKDNEDSAVSHMKSLVRMLIKRYLSHCPIRTSPLCRPSYVSTHVRGELKAAKVQEISTLLSGFDLSLGRRTAKE